MKIIISCSPTMYPNLIVISNKVCLDRSVSVGMKAGSKPVLQI